MERSWWSGYEERRRKEKKSEEKLGGEGGREVRRQSEWRSWSNVGALWGSMGYILQYSPDKLHRFLYCLPEATTVLSYLLLLARIIMHTKYIWQHITETVWPRFNVDLTMPQVVFEECGAKCQTRLSMPSSCPTEFAQGECASVLVPYSRLDFVLEKKPTCSSPFDNPLPKQRLSELRNRNKLWI